MRIGNFQFDFSERRRHENVLEYERARPDPAVIADYLSSRSDVITIDACRQQRYPNMGNSLGHSNSQSSDERHHLLMALYCITRIVPQLAG